MSKEEIKDYFSDKTVLITGVCGSIGAGLLDYIASYLEPKKIIGLDNNETEIFLLQKQYGKHNNVQFRYGDVRDLNRMNEVFYGVDIVLHTVAMKHVGISELSPDDAIQTNIYGLQNVISASIKNEIKTFIFTSSDKAVNPTNVMGTTKLMGERLVTAANNLSQNKNTIFASTRFGNVVGSRGSVIPIFRQQILNNEPLTITDVKMTRFFMSNIEAILLVLNSACIAKGGEVFVTKMPVLSIFDLAKAIFERERKSEQKFSYNLIGKAPGEKLYEELMTEEETSRALELKDYFVVLPALRNFYSTTNYQYANVLSETVTKAYNSSLETKMSEAGISDYLDNIIGG